MKKFGILLIVALVAAGAFAVYWFREPAEQRIDVHLVPGPPVPRVTAAEAGIDPAAIQLAVDYAGKRNTSALVIGHNGHIAFERYWGSTTPDTKIAAANFSAPLVALLVGSAMNDRLPLNLDEPVATYLPEYADTPVGRSTIRDHLGQRVEGSGIPSSEVMALVLERVTKQPFETLVTERIWKPMSGGEFSLRRNDDKAVRKGAATAGCCVVASIGDWMRVGELLANDGVFEGNQVTPPRYVTLMMTPTHKDSVVGLGVNVGGQFATRNVGWLDGGKSQRLWVIPSLRLVILRVGDEPAKSEGWDEAMIPDSIIRGTSGWQPGSAHDGTDPNKFAPH